MSGKRFSLLTEVILDFCENVFHFRFLVKIMIFGNVLIYPHLTAVDAIWYEYCFS